MKRFICALSLKHADSTAVIDWGWKRTGPSSWTNKQGDTVRYLATTRDLYACSPGCVLYMGFQWFENDRLEGVEIVAQARRALMRHTGEN